MKRWLDAVPERWLLVMFLCCVAFWAVVVFGVTRALAGS